LAELRDFCNRTGIPARRKGYWGHSTWNAILQPSVILEYCGYAVWNARTKEGRNRPPSEWVIVPKAHPALITEDEARGIIAARRRAQKNATIRPAGQSLRSQCLLSGGLFRCGRCSANMTGFRKSHSEYYICGSQPYRRGTGCGPGVWLPRQAVGAEVFKGIADLLNLCADPKGLARQVNEELQRLWQESVGQTGRNEAPKEVAAIDTKIANIRRAIEDGLGDASTHLTVQLPLPIADRVRYPAALVDRVRDLAHRLPDAEIGNQLNREGHASPKGKSYTTRIVRWIRGRYQIPPTTLRRPEELTVQQVAQHFGVNKYVVYYWIKRSRIQAPRINCRSPYWITLNASDEQKLQDRVRNPSRLPKSKLSPNGTVEGAI
jgi:Recombinase